MGSKMTLGWTRRKTTALSPLRYVPDFRFSLDRWLWETKPYSFFTFCAGLVIQEVAQGMGISLSGPPIKLLSKRKNISVGSQRYHERTLTR